MLVVACRARCHDHQNRNRALVTCIRFRHPDEVPALIAALEAACLTEGRIPSTIERTLGIMIDQRPEGDRTPMVNPAVVPLTGTTQEIAVALRAFAAHGISHLQIIPVIQGARGSTRSHPCSKNTLGVECVKT